MTDTKLAPCPFCGKECSTVVGAYSFYAGCDSCHINFSITGYLSSDETYRADAIAAWNQRVPTPAQAAAEEMVKVLSGLTVDGYGIFEDPRGQRWRLSLPITEADKSISLADKMGQISAALARAKEVL